MILPITRGTNYVYNFTKEIIFMLCTIDGIATGDFIDKDVSDLLLYCDLEYSFNSKVILLGRPTMEEAIEPGEIDLSKFKDVKIDRNDYVAPQINGYYYITIDCKGKLKWKKSFFCANEAIGRKQKSQSITILSEEVSDAYLAYLQSIQVSYIFAGKDKIDLKIALQKLKKLFGFNRIICEGGPTTNSSFLKEDLVQKIIFLQAPYIASPGGKTLLGDAKLQKWNLDSLQLLNEKNSLLLSYVKP